MRLAALALIFSGLALSTERVEVTATEKAALPPGGTVRVEGSVGELNVEGWDQPGVEVVMTRYSWSDHQERAKKSLDQIQLSKQLSGNVLTLTTSHRRFSDAQVTYRIRVPHNANLVIRHGTGTVNVFDVSGNIDAAARAGDVLVQLPENAKYEIDAHTKAGGIYSDFRGVEHKPLRTGETLKPTAAGSGETRQIHLHTGVGGITIQKVPAWPLLSLNQL